MHSSCVWIVFVTGCVSLFPPSSFAASQENVLLDVSGRALCRQFNNVEIKNDWFSSYGRDVPREAAAVFEKTLTKLGCVVYHGTGKRNGVITVGLSFRRLVRDDLLGPGPREENSIFRVSLSWSRGIENAETLPLTFIFTRDGSADFDYVVIENVATQSLQELERAIRAIQNKRKVSGR